MSRSLSYLSFPPKRVKLNDSVETVEKLMDSFQQSRIEHSTDKCDSRRIRVLSSMCQSVNDNKLDGGIVYWMSRDSRVQDNWAMIYAQELANAHNLPLYVIFCLPKRFLNASLRQFHFLIEGLKLIHEECKQLNITFVVLNGSGDEILVDWVKKYNIAGIVCDFNPLRIVRRWTARVKTQLPPDVYFVQVDAHNIVPCWVASDKQESSADSMRSKLKTNMKTFLKPFPLVIKHSIDSKARIDPATCDKIDWNDLLESRDADKSVGPVTWAQAGYTNACVALAEFIDNNLWHYKETRNDVNADSQSNMSPWYHFGHISVQRVVWYLIIAKMKHFESNVESYIEECFVRRELADNFCYYNINYDRFDNAPNNLHLNKKQHCYNRKELDNAKTHDKLWNDAQTQLKGQGRMHGHVRMYWAKKISEWSISPTAALINAIHFNDKYSLDGCDPNGYAGCLWSICGTTIEPKLSDNTIHEHYKK
ncbi:DNA photolyase [Erannis ankeraria nucleopolyhedrovirus]|uniref:DNA photolyase n=1 Tax=Erannis ankeraria nucleopolyhedrovirus TaxID=2913600 RepID=UPI00117AD7AC|nr:DNA photolyase [Erannis ankeraria nucleopolyhedrovirus]UJZ89069.1 DNA photolyase [Erannis ankeraria nucleopolyhedrovirus]